MVQIISIHPYLPSPNVNILELSKLGNQNWQNTMSYLQTLFKCLQLFY